MPLSVRELLDRSRRELLDLSTRNRLLSIPVNSKSARIVQVHNENSEQIFRLLVSEKKSMSFLPGRQAKADETQPTSSSEDEEEIDLPQPDEEVDPATGLAKSHVDLRLQTSLTPEGLQRRLLSLYHDAVTMIEEHGVNILYLALGQLQWFEVEKTDSPRFAPLILVPIELQRKTASDRFHIRWREEDIQENLSLEAKLKTDFGIQLPPFPDEEAFNPAAYFKEVTKVIVDAKGWQVLPDAIALGFFSFAKFLMYRDLDPDNWPESDKLLKHPIITGLIQDGFPKSEPLVSEEAHLDEIIPASRLDHVVDADSSQTLAIEMVRQGRSLVIQGPPGTGKSQSITNIIATAVLDGKKVLFVAEKLAALEVVKRRLEKEGLGPLCLELHSHKSNKRIVLDEIGKTWKLGQPRIGDLESIVPRLEQRRAILNGHARLLHEKLLPSGLTPFLIIGRIAVLGDRGKEVAEVTFSGAEAWTSEDRAERRKLCEELAARVQQIGLPSQHPWRGVCRETILNIDLSSIEIRIRTFLDRLSEFQETSAALSSSVSYLVPDTLKQADQLRITSNYVAQAPPVDKQALCSSVWNAGLEGLRELLSQGRKFLVAFTQAGPGVSESTWDKDFSDLRTFVAAHGRSLFRLLNGDYRRSVAQLRGSLTGKLPNTYEERLSLIDQIIAGQRALRSIREGSMVGEAAFGTFWRREKSDWNQLEAVLDWVARQRDAGLEAGFRQMFASVGDQKYVAELVKLFDSRLTALREEAQKLSGELSLDFGVAFNAPDIAHVSIQALKERCVAWLSHLEELTRWNNYFLRARRARELGLSVLVERLETGIVQTAAIADCFDRVYFSQLLRDIIRKKPEIAQFDGALHDNHVTEFKQLDRDRLALAKYRVLSTHHQCMPLSSGVGPAGIVKSELERKRGHRTVRRLLKDAGSVLQAIKPVFMMSPLSVAQFLEPGAVEFDLLVVDEASQVQPVDALGAISRCKQIVVVGDSKQLPPTRFFARLTSDSGETDDEEDSLQTAEAKDIESILGLCGARGLPQTMLRWHYRSRHHSLIAVSNREFYEDRLYIVPSPYSAAAGLGVKFNYVAEGVFDSGGSGTNRVEAKAICRAVVDHARKTPNLSLGAAAFSVRQRQAILDELELVRRENPDIEAFFSDHATEPFFVKNLENVQGDERDVIFISVGYGRDVHGYMAMRFGPLSNEGGERRLNVLISRAKKRCEVFSSITADDIDLERASGRGVAALKTFLSFAQTGRLATAQASGLEEQSPFEEAVRRAVESLGYEVVPQVGIAGFFIDLAVVDRERQGRYILGIECDGAAYHSCRSARDRDRLRQAVLEDHGWIIHRIWSTDWFQRPNEQLRKVEEAIKRAKVIVDEVTRNETPFMGSKVTGVSDDCIEREIVSEIDDRGLERLAKPYSEATFEVPRNREPHELSTKEMANIVLRILEHEGPVHEDEVVTRVRGLWGLSRAGTRIQDVVAKGVRSLLVTKKCKREDGFLTIPDKPVPVRNRRDVSSANLRKPELLPPVEIRAAILALIDAHHGAVRKEIPVAVARMLGFKTTSGQLRVAVDEQITKLTRQGTIEERGDMFNRSNSLLR